MESSYLAKCFLTIFSIELLEEHLCFDPKVMKHSGCSVFCNFTFEWMRWFGRELYSKGRLCHKKVNFLYFALFFVSFFEENDFLSVCLQGRWFSWWICYSGFSKFRTNKNAVMNHKVNNVWMLVYDMVRNIYDLLSVLSEVALQAFLQISSFFYSERPRLCSLVQAHRPILWENYRSKNIGFFKGAEYWKVAIWQNASWQSFWWNS